jgi:hypothetical protein
MLVFIDESGDAGMKLGSGSSPYFCVLAAVFKDNFSADACDRGIDQLRRELRKPSRHEFHFSHCPHPIKESFLRCVSQEQFSYDAFVIDKSRLFSPKFRDAKAFYEFAVSIVCENAGQDLADAKVVIDKNGNREFLQRLQRTLKCKLNGNGENIVRKVAMQDSQSNNLVQLADMACGAVAHSITAGDHRFRNIIRKRNERRVQCWPKN